jgi:hypothetical protein
MKNLNWLFCALVVVSSGVIQAQEEKDSAMTQIHKIDLGQEGESQPTMVLLQFDVKKLKVPSAHSHVILRQLSKAVRVEVEGAELPKGNYAVAVSGDCSSAKGAISASQYKSSWTELHQVECSSAYLASEKSHPEASLRKGDGSKVVLEGKSLALFKVSKGSYTPIDCKPIK